MLRSRSIYFWHMGNAGLLQDRVEASFVFSSLLSSFAGYKVLVVAAALFLAGFGMLVGVLWS